MPERGIRRYQLPMNMLQTRRGELSAYAHKRTLQSVGTKRYTGEMAVLRLTLHDKLKTDWKTPNTYAKFEEIIAHGIDPRVRKKGKSFRENIYIPTGYTHAIAEAMNTDEQIIRREIRALRATAVYEARVDPKADFNPELYKSVVKLFEADQAMPKTQRDENLVDFMAKWDGSVVSFYKLINERKEAGTSGAWLSRFLPYEMDFFEKLVKHLRKNKDRASILTLKVAQDIVNKYPVPEIAKRIKGETHVPVDEVVIDEYLNVLSKDFAS